MKKTPWPCEANVGIERSKRPPFGRAPSLFDSPPLQGGGGAALPYCFFFRDSRDTRRPAPFTYPLAVTLSRRGWEPDGDPAGPWAAAPAEAFCAARRKICRERNKNPLAGGLAEEKGRKGLWVSFHPSPPARGADLAAAFLFRLCGTSRSGAGRREKAKGGIASMMSGATPGAGDGRCTLRRGHFPSLRFLVSDTHMMPHLCPRVNAGRAFSGCCATS